MYAITDEGRSALNAWLAEPGGGLSLEFEALLKVFFAEQASRADVLANVAAIRSWAEEHNARNVAFARHYVETGGPFPDRLPAITLTGRFLTDLADMVERWAAWAGESVEAWPDDPAEAEPDWATLRAIASRPVEAAELPAPGHRRT